MKVIKLQDRSARVAVYGQLIKTGYFDDRRFSEALTMRVTLQLSYNPSLLQNGRYPTGGRGFEIHTDPVPAL